MRDVGSAQILQDFLLRFVPQEILPFIEAQIAGLDSLQQLCLGGRLGDLRVFFSLLLIGQLLLNVLQILPGFVRMWIGRVGPNEGLCQGKLVLGFGGGIFHPGLELGEVVIFRVLVSGQFLEHGVSFGLGCGTLL